MRTLKNIKLADRFYEDLRNQLIRKKFEEQNDTEIAKIISLLDIGAAGELDCKVGKADYKWLFKRQNQYATMRDITWITNSENKNAIQQLYKLPWITTYRKQYFDKLRQYGLCSNIK